MMNIQDYSLAKGILLRFVNKEDYKNASFSLSFRYRVKRNCSTADYLVTKLLTQTTRKYPEERLLSQKLEELYSSDLSSWSYRYGENRFSVFSISYLDDFYSTDINNLSECMFSLLSSAVLQPDLDKKGNFKSQIVKLESQNLYDRIQSVKNNKRAYASKRIVELMTDPENYEIPDYGNEQEIASLSPSLLLERYKELLNNSEILFTYVGPSSFEKIVSLIKQYFSPLLFDRSVRMGKLNSCRKKASQPINRIYEETDGQQSILCLGYRMKYGISEPGGRSLGMFSAILSDSPMALLFSEVREKYGYCYSIRASVSQSSRIFAIFAGIDKENAEKVEKEIRKVVSDVARGNVSNSLLSSSMRYITMGARSLSDNADDLCAFITRKSLIGQSPDPEDVMENAKSETIEMLSAYAKSLKLDTVFLLAPKGEA